VIAWGCERRPRPDPAGGTLLPLRARFLQI